MYNTKRRCRELTTMLFLLIIMPSLPPFPHTWESSSICVLYSVRIWFRGSDMEKYIYSIFLEAEVLAQLIGLHVHLTEKMKQLEDTKQEFPYLLNYKPVKWFISPSKLLFLLFFLVITEETSHFGAKTQTSYRTLDSICSCLPGTLKKRLFFFFSYTWIPPVN